MPVGAPSFWRLGNQEKTGKALEEVASAQEEVQVLPNGFKKVVIFQKQKRNKDFFSNSNSFTPQNKSMSAEQL